MNTNEILDKVGGLKRIAQANNLSVSKVTEFGPPF